MRHGRAPNQNRLRGCLLEPECGRPHQLRVAASSLGRPLLGDLKYRASQTLPDRSIALHAFKLELEHPTLRTRLGFTAAAPAIDAWDFATVRSGAG